jgi:lipopolysaccharide export LptBFGC system permease protein LptF
MLFRNRADYRTWYMQINRDTFHGYLQVANFELRKLKSVHITQQDERGNILSKYYARGAAFDPFTKVWTFYKGKSVNFDREGNVTSDENWDARKFTGWSETPWRIVSSNLEGQNLSVPELRDYLKFNADYPEVQLAPFLTHYYYRWAVPASCMVIVLIAAPLGIVYSRRGVLAGVANSIFIFFGMMFLEKLFLALGKGDRIPAIVAAWSPDAIFAAIGLVLVYMRSSNTDFSKFNVRTFFKPHKRA